MIKKKLIEYERVSCENGLFQFPNFMIKGKNVVEINLFRDNDDYYVFVGGEFYISDIRILRASEQDNYLTNRFNRVIDKLVSDIKLWGEYVRLNGDCYRNHNTLINRGISAGEHLQNYVNELGRIYYTLANISQLKIKRVFNYEGRLIGGIFSLEGVELLNIPVLLQRGVLWEVEGG